MSTPACPAHGRRRSIRAGEATTPRIEVRGDVWHIRSMPTVREVLRAGSATVQAGFNADYIGETRMRKPILFLDGPEHRAQRRKIARYFAPKTVSTRYQDFMRTRADELVARIAELGGCRLDDVSMRYSVEVAAQVIGLAEADMPGMSQRIGRFFSTPALPPRTARFRPGRFAVIDMSVRGMLSSSEFFRRDVRPAIRRRREHPGDDVISHLLAEGYTDAEILTECVTYAAAGMVTTREFISMATWHLLDDDTLRGRYLVAGETERRAILAEILRLEPVVGHLYRRTTAPLLLTDGEEEYVVPEGALLDLYVRSANADEAHVRPDPLDLCPGRELPPRISGEVMSFGDGNHTCPGAHLAMSEADVFLVRLLRLPLELLAPPTIGWDDLISGYELRGVELRVRPRAAPTGPARAALR